MDEIKVLMVEPQKAPYVAKIENTLAGQQQAVQGYIQYLYNDDNTILVCNEEGKLNGMQGNRRIDGDVLVGPFFVAGDDGEELRSLTDEEVEKYTARFAEVEDISIEEIEANSGFMMLGL